jgi:hypothetical protein
MLTTCGHCGATHGDVRNEQVLSTGISTDSVDMYVSSSEFVVVIEKRLAVLKVPW